MEQDARANETIPLPLLPILESLPSALQALIIRRPSPEAKISMRLGKLTEQFSSGVVRILFDSFRRQCPPGTFENTKVDPHLMVKLPLEEVWKAIEPFQVRRLVLPPEE